MTHTVLQYNHAKYSFDVLPQKLSLAGCTSDKVATMVGSSTLGLKIKTKGKIKY
jgi:hypothetical protein